MTLTFGMRTRVLVIVLALVAVAAGLLVFMRTQKSASSAPPPAATTTAPTTPAAHKPAVTPAQSSATATQPESGGMPAAITQALAANKVVVVALYDPKAKIDDTALSEAMAGAKLAGTEFVQIDVTTDQVDALNAKYGVIQDPAVLVLRPPGDLVVRIDGFADRDTVAQAAANAAAPNTAS